MLRRDDAKVFFDRGNALLALKRHDEALACYDKALVIHPSYLAALHNRGLALRSLKRHAEALASHDRALAINPNDAQGLFIRGNALCALMRYDQALASYDKALAIHPSYVEALHNRGLALRNLARPLEGLASHDRALAIRPNDGEGLYNRGNALLELKRFEEALISYDRALSINPNHVEALHNRGIIALRYLKRPEEALAAYDRALALDPSHADALANRGTVLLMLKRPQEAIASYRRARENGGDSEEIAYLLAGLGAASSPVAAPRKFVTELFDQSADVFEQHMVGTLKYNAPALIFDGIARCVSAHNGSTGNFDVLDLGCGTGLVGARLRPLARSLTGIDLSPNMLEQARRRGVYDQLVCADLTDFLQAQPGQFDLVVAGDVFIYVGDLSKVFQGVRGALRGGGLFGFSVETNGGSDFALGTALRYAHSVGYLQRLANDNRLAVESIQPGVIRQEDGVDVSGHVLIMRSPA